MRLAARNLGSNYLAYAASVVSGLVLTPIIIDALGQEGYGAWIFIISLTTMLRLLDFGITPTVVRFTALHRGQHNAAEIDALASASLAVFLILGLVSLGVGLVLAWFLPGMIALPPELEQPAQVATVIAVLTLGTQAPLGLFGSLLKGVQRFDVLNVGALASIVAYTLLVVVVLTRQSTLPMLALIAFGAMLIRVGYPILYVRRELPGLRLSAGLVSRARVRGLLSFSGFAFLGHVAGKIIYSADVIVIGAVLGAKQVALYGVASRLFGLVAGVAATGTDLLLPFQSELEGRGEHARQRLFLATGIRASACVAVLLGFPLVVLPSWILTAWLGAGFEESVTPLAILGAAVLFATTNSVLAQYLFARGRPALLAAAQSILAAVNLGLTITLLLTVGDIWTAALATLVAESIGAVLVLPLLARRSGTSTPELIGAWAKPVAAGVVAALPTLVLARATTDTSSLLLLALVGALWAGAFAAVAWRLALTGNERALIRSLLGRRRERTSSP
jgi:O-antigen/teichoic acid export membrane protein